MKVKKFHEDAVIPTKAHATDAGYDLYSLEERFLPGLDKHSIEYFDIPTSKIRTGVGLEIPAGYVGLIWDRSSMGSKGVSVHGGVIDHGYTGEIQVCLTNHTNSSFTVKKGDKIAQILIQPVTHFDLEEVEDFSVSDRGDKGFGSSGT